MASKKKNWKSLNDLWKVGVREGKYSKQGDWFHLLTSFPGALFDKSGYVLFKSEDGFLLCPHLEITGQVNCRPPGISKIPGYKRMV